MLSEWSSANRAEQQRRKVEGFESFNNSFAHSVESRTFRWTVNIAARLSQSLNKKLNKENSIDNWVNNCYSSEQELLSAEQFQLFEYLKN